MLLPIILSVIGLTAASLAVSALVLVILHQCSEAFGGQG